MENISHYIVEKAFQKRQILAIYGFFGYFMAYSMRTILSVAIIDMNESSQPENLSNNTHLRNSSSSTDQVLHPTLYFSYSDSIIVYNTLYFFLSSSHGHPFFKDTFCRHFSTATF